MPVNKGLKPWQFRQVVDAIQNLYSVVNTEWASTLDWDFWRDSARTVDAVAREQAPVTPQEFANRIGDTRLASLIRAHLPLFATFASAMRTGGMSFRTEKAARPGWDCCGARPAAPPD